VTPASREVDFERRGAVAMLTLSAPERRNALTPEMADAVSAACDAVDADESIGAVVIRGAGGTFCAGAELAALRRVGEDPAEDQRYRELDRIYGAFLRVARMRAPTIAAVRGAAVGAGLNLALATDLRVVAVDARLIAGFLRIGVHPGGGGLTLLHRLAGQETAAAVALFGEELDGRRAQALGLAWDAVADDRVDDRALELAGVAARDPALARRAVRSLRAEAGSRLPLEVAAEYERGNQLWSLRRRALEGPG
jgi:enoyl-CoA hydratase